MGTAATLHVGRHGPAYCLAHTQPHCLCAAGGAILLEDGASLAVTNCAFERNWGHDGGAVDVKARLAAAKGWRAASCHAFHTLSYPSVRVAVQNGSAVDIVGSTFQSNKAGVTGGALRVQASVADARTLSM